MNEILATRRAYGDVFATSFADGTIVPWKLLTVDDYIHYDMLYKAQLYPDAFVEDEIFCKSVLDKSLIDNIDRLKAGTVSFVVQSILQFSGPGSPDDITQMLEIKRYESTNILHDMVIWICQAFPGYTPDDLYSMKYPDFMLRFAQAEIKLLRSGVITEPFSYTSLEKEQPQPKPNRTARLNQKPATPPPPKPPKANMAKQFEKQQEQTIITKADIIESTMAMSGHDQDIVYHQKVAEETAALYPEYLEQMKRGEKVKVPSTEERVAAAEKRQAENKRKYLEAQKNYQEFSKQELERLKQEREKERRRRQKQRKH